MLRPDALQQRLRTRGAPARAALRRRLRRRRGGRLAVGLVRGDGARAVRAPRPRAPATRGCSARSRRSARASSSCPSSWSTSSAWRTSAPYFPHRVTYHPTCHSLRLLGIGDAPLRLLRGVARARPRRAPRGRRVLRLRRDLRGEERRHLDGHADRQAARRARHRRRGLRAADNSCLMHIGGGLSRQRTGSAPIHAGRDPRRAMTEVVDAPFPEAAREALGDAQLRRNMRHGDADDPREARRASSAELPDWEALREAGRGDQGARRCATSTEHLERPRAAVDRARRRGPLGPRRGRGQRDRRPDRRGRHGARRGHQGQVADHRRDRAQRGAGRAPASRRSRPTWPS